MVQFPLVKDSQQITKAFDKILKNYRTCGGGNIGESSVDALWKAVEGFQFRQSAIPVFLLFTDEPPLDPDTKKRTMSHTIREFKKRKIVCFCITIRDKRFENLSKETGGVWFQIFSDVDFLSILDRLFVTVVDRVEEIALKLPPTSTQRALPP